MMRYLLLLFLLKSTGNDSIIFSEEGFYLIPCKWKKDK